MLHLLIILQKIYIYIKYKLINYKHHLNVILIYIELIKILILQEDKYLIIKYNIIIIMLLHLIQLLLKNQLVLQNKVNYYV